MVKGERDVFAEEEGFRPFTGPRVKAKKKSTRNSYNGRNEKNHMSTLKMELNPCEANTNQEPSVEKFKVHRVRGHQLFARGERDGRRLASG